MLSKPVVRYFFYSQLKQVHLNNTLYSSTMKTALISYDSVFFEIAKHFNECWENQIEICSPHKQADIASFCVQHWTKKTKSCAFSRDEIHVWRLTSRYFARWKYFLPQKIAEKKSSTCRNIRIPKHCYGCNRLHFICKKRKLYVSYFN